MVKVASAFIYDRWDALFPGRKIYANVELTRNTHTHWDKNPGNDVESRHLDRHCNFNGDSIL